MLDAERDFLIPNGKAVLDFPLFLHKIKKSRSQLQPHPISVILLNGKHKNS